MKTLIQSLLLIFALNGVAHAVDIRSNESVNINTASASQIAETLDGVGIKRANAIVEYRQVHGAFKSAAGLAAVKGIGESTVDINKRRIRLK